jgi:hypothetical protein
MTSPPAIAPLAGSVSGLAGAVSALLAGSLGARRRERLVMSGAMLATGFAIYPTSTAGLATMVGFLPGPIEVGPLTPRQHPSCNGRVLAVSISLNVISPNMAGLPISSAPGGASLSRGDTTALRAAAIAAWLGCLNCLVIPARSREAVSPDGTSSAGFSC